MGAILGLHQINFKSGNEELIAVWGKAAMVRRSSQWILTNGYITTGTKCYFENFLDKAFMVNGTDTNQLYDGSAWSKTLFSLDASPIANYIKRHNTRLYLFNIKIAGVSYPSRCWYSDLPKEDAVKWGLEDGTDLVSTAGSAIVTSVSSNFVGKNIKVGDPLTITTGINKGEHIVQSIDSQTQLTLTSSLSNGATGSSFWVGSNWFDVETDDGDIGMSMGVTSNELFLYKKNSVSRFNAEGLTLRRLKNMPGTTSPRSIVEGSDGYLYSYHPSGIWRTSGTTGQLISNPIYDIIEGVTAANQDEVVGWEKDRKIIKMSLGDVTLRDGETITDCFVAFDETTNAWTTGSLPKTIKCVTPWLHGSVLETYAGDDDGGVFQLDTGTDFDGTEIPSEIVLYPIFPAGSEAIVDFRRIRLYVENGPDVQVLYRLVYHPTGNEKHWKTDDDWIPMEGSQRAERSEWVFPSTKCRASGVQLKIVESSKDESFLIEKIVCYYSGESNR
jgi:hypothetical protein